MESGRKTLIAIFTAAIFSCLCNCLPAAEIKYSNIRFKQFSVADGLPHNTINSITQDGNGFLWIGTPNGLCKFDGYTFQYFSHDPDDTSSIFHNFIQKLYSDTSRNRLWISTDRGFGCYDLNTECFRKYEIRGVSRKSISFLNTSSGDLLAGTFEGVYLYDSTSDSFLDYIRIPGSFVNQIAEDKRNTLWINCDNGIMRYDLESHSFIPLPPALAAFKGNILNMYMTVDERIIFNDGSDFILFDIKSGTLSILHKEIDTKGYRCADCDSEGNIWIGTEFGIFIYDSSNRLIAHFDQTPSDLSNLNDSPVYCIFKDSSDNMWVGTYFGGINYFIAGTDQFQTYPVGNSKHHLSGKAVRQIVNDPDGGLFIATEDGGLNHMDSNKRITRSDIVHNKLGIRKAKNVHSVYFDSDSDMWIGLFLKGLMKFSRQTHTLTDYGTRINYNTSAFCIEESGNGKIWYCGPEGLFMTYKDGESKVRKIAGGRMFCTLKQNDSTIWIGSRNNGLYSLNTDTDSLTRLSLLSNLELFITYLYKDSKGRVWIGTNNNGLYLSDQTGKITASFQKDKLGTNAIKGIIEDNYGNIWTGTDNGLCRISSEDMSVTRYTDSDGLPIKQFNYASACKRPDGELFFGTINGMVSFYPEQIRNTSPDFKIRVTNIWSNSDRMSPLSEKANLPCTVSEITSLILTHKQARSLRIEYSGLNFRYNNTTRYAMKMDGLDKVWQDVGNQHQVRFSNLNAGKYILRIKASYDGRNWDDAGQLNLPITVRAPWWATVWAFAFYFTIAICIGLYAFRYTKSRLLLRMKLKTEQEKRINIEKLNKQKTDFFSYISHDLKTPLTLILSPLQRLIAQKQITNDDRKKLEVIYTNANRMNYLIDELLTFSKIEMKQMHINVRKGNIMHFLEGISQIFKIISKEKDIEFILCLENTEEEVWFSPSKLERIMYNLLSNAFKYSQAGDYVKLSARLLHENDFTIAEISVKDSGRGIPEDMQSRIFENYFQVKTSDQREGFGLGLSLTKSLVNMHKGDIKVSSEEGKGSEFTVTLKVSENAYSDQEKSLESITADEIDKYNKRMIDTVELIPDRLRNNPEDSHREIILIVEDNREMNEYIADIFSSRYDVLRAYNGLEACAIMEKKTPDIIISDVMMPGMDGFEFSRRVKEDVKTCHIPVILLTAKTDEKDHTEGYISGADAYITKPFNSQNLELLVQNIQTGRKRNIEHFKQAEELNITQITNNPRDEMFMKNLVDLIMENLGNETFDVTEITSALHISRSLLHNKIKALSGSSITQFIRTIKMKEAKKFLLSGMNVSETSYAVGISDPNYFTKCFRKEFGITPTEFMKGTDNSNEPSDNISIEE